MSNVSNSTNTPQQKESNKAMYNHFIIPMHGPRSLQTIPADKKQEQLAIAVNTLTKVKAAEAFINILTMHVAGKRLVVTVICGMAEGFDKLMLIAAFQVKLNVHLAIPTKSYGSYYWGKNSLTGQDQSHQFQVYVDMANAQTICKKNVTYVMEDVHHITKGLYIGKRHANFLRNDWMIEKGDFFFIYEPDTNAHGAYTSGTADALRSVKKANKPYMLFVRSENDWFYQRSLDEIRRSY